jgi:hypothetical protein
VLFPDGALVCGRKASVTLALMTPLPWLSLRAAKRGDHVLPTGEVLSDVAVVRGSSGALSFRFTRSLRGSGSAGHNASVTLNPASAPFVWGIFPSWTVRATHSLRHARC